MIQKVTCVIPAYNEEKTIRSLILRASHYCDKILVPLAKRSSDNTEGILKSLKVEYFRDRGMGKGDGMRLAISKIHGGVIVFMDADGSHTAKDIPQLVKPVMEGKADMVIASRLLGGSEELHGDLNKILRRFFSWCIGKIISLRFITARIDTQNGFRAIDAKVAKKLNLESNHTEIETEMVMKCFKNKYRILEVQSRELKRKFGESNIKLSKHGWRYLWTVIKNFF